MSREWVVVIFLMVVVGGLSITAFYDIERPTETAVYEAEVLGPYYLLGNRIDKSSVNVRTGDGKVFRVFSNQFRCGGLKPGDKVKVIEAQSGVWGAPLNRRIKED